MNFLKYVRRTKQKSPAMAAIESLKTWREERGHIEQPLTYGPRCPKCEGWNTGPGEYSLVTGKVIFQYRCFTCLHGWGEQGIQLMEPADPKDIGLVMQGCNSTVLTVGEIIARKSPEVAAARDRLSKRKIYININEYFSR